MFFKKDRPSTSAYDALETKDSEALIASSSEETLHSCETRPAPPRRQSLQSHLATVAYVLGIAAAMLAGIILGRLQTRPLSNDELILKVSQNSPMLEDIDIKYSVIQFNGTFLNENIFRQDASPEVDAAWKSLGADYRPVAVPDHLAQKVGLAQDQVKIRKKYGGGYPANVEGLHHLHCLNLLRKTLYYNYNYYHALGEGPFINDDHIVRKHTTHCLDILRQQLMCTVDIAVLGQVWWDDGNMVHSFTDFNTKHKCRNFDAVRQWAEEHQLPEHAPEDFLEPPKDGDHVYSEIP